MKHGKLILVLIVVLAVLVLSCGFIYVSEDKSGPVIQVSSEDGDVYDESLGNDGLLQGVTASDRRDGDVSDTLRVASVVPGQDGTSVTVTYTAKDKSNNVTELRRTMSVSGTQAASDGQEETDQQENESVETSSSSQSREDTASAEENQTENSGETANNTSEADTSGDADDRDEAEIAALPSGSPSIRLTTHNATIGIGETWNYLDYIAQMSDDQDTTERLSRTINITGDVDTSRAGTYDVTYSITDSDGNRSNQPVLHITVQ